MIHIPIFPAGSTSAIQFAADYLHTEGYTVTGERPDGPCCLLLDVPSFSRDTMQHGNKNTEVIFSGLHPDSIVFGGNLHTLTASPLRKIDLLKDEAYLLENAKITAYCTLSIAAQTLPVTLDQTNTLIIGWGRIGRVLTQLLRSLHTPVTVAARNPLHLQILNSLAIPAAPLQQIFLKPFRLIINTVPYPVLDSFSLSNCPGAVKIDLASTPGLEASDVIRARGLPGLHAPESSGHLIGETVKRHLEVLER